MTTASLVVVVGPHIRLLAGWDMGAFLMPRKSGGWW